MAFYHDIITEKSWEELQRLQQQLDFVLIGGWATYLYTKALKSKDIDILIDFDQLPRLAGRYMLTKNDRLKKYEAVLGEVQIDVYLPYYSRLGIPVEELHHHAKIVEGFMVLDPNYLAALKMYTLTQRGRSSKGRKDFIDIIALFQKAYLDQAALKEILSAHGLESAKQHLLGFLDESSELSELNLNAHKFAKLKADIQVLLK